MMNDQGPNWGPNGALSDGYSVTAEELGKESAEVVRVSGKDAHWAPSLGGVSGTSSGEETSGKTQD